MAWDVINNSPTPPQGDVPEHLWSGYDFSGKALDRLNQGPFGIHQDEGWFTVASTTATRKPIRNFGTGLVGYVWDITPTATVAEGRDTLESQVEKLASLPFVDQLYLRCDWRDVQSRPGRLNLHPVWALAIDAARRYGKRICFRITMSNTEGPDALALPAFLREQVPYVKIGSFSGVECREPRYDHPSFRKAFRELNELLAADFDGNPLVEFADLMMYGYWGEGHSFGSPAPFPDYLTAERTFLDLTGIQIETWKKTPLVVNAECDISAVGNNAVHDMAVRSGCWVRIDSVMVLEPYSVEIVANRPAHLAAVIEDGTYRKYSVAPGCLPVDEIGMNGLDHMMRHVLDLGGNYWSLWTEPDNLAQYNEVYPAGIAELQARLGYRVRPSWVWQRKRHGTAELIVAIANDGVASVPGALRVVAETPDGLVRVGGSLDDGHPHAGRLRQASLLLPPECFGKIVNLRAELVVKGITRPVAWACAQPLNADGSLPVRLLDRDDENWRKGI